MSQLKKYTAEDEKYYNTVIAELPMLHDGSGNQWMRNPLPPEEIAELNKPQHVEPAKPQPVKAEPKASTGGPNTPIVVDSALPAEGNGDVEETVFDGSAVGYFWHLVWWGIICFFTLGICYPITICMKQRYLAKRVIINGHHLKFKGKAGSIFGRYLLWFLLTIVTLGIFGFWLEKKVNNWVAANMNYEGANQEEKGKYDGSALLLALLRLGLFLFSLVTLGIGYYQAKCWETRYILKHTFYKGRQLYFDGKGAAYFGRSLLWTLLFMVTLGIYGMWIPGKELWWFTIHTRFIDAPARTK